MDVLKILGGMFELLGGLFSFLGPFGVSLFLLTFLLLAMVSALSPLSRMTNYGLVIVIVLGLAIWKGISVEQIIPYLVVMALPVLLVQGLDKALTRFRIPKGQDLSSRLARIDALTEQLNEEVRALKALK